MPRVSWDLAQADLANIGRPWPSRLNVTPRTSCTSYRLSAPTAPPNPMGSGIAVPAQQHSQPADDTDDGTDEPGDEPHGFLFYRRQGADRNSR